MPVRLTRKPAAKSDSAVGIFARNLSILIEQRQQANPGTTKAKIAKTLGISTRKLTDVRSGAHVPGIDTIDAAADLFKIAPWQLLLPDLPAELLLNPQLQRTIRALVESDPKDQEAVEHLLTKRRSLA